MLKYFFLMVVNTSLISSLLIVSVIIIRLLLYRTPKHTRLFLWGIVALRLSCPFFLNLNISIVPDFGFSEQADISEEKTDNLNFDSVTNFAHANDEHIKCENNLSNVNISEIDRTEKHLSVFCIIWIFGMGVMLTIFLLESIVIWKKIRYAVHKEKMGNLFRKFVFDNTNPVFFSDQINTSFTKGMLRPKIYIPSDVEISDLPFILEHEKIHINRRDMFWKQLGYCILAIHWFNPLVWVAYSLYCRDVEYSCDERVVLNLGEGKKSAYIKALIHNVERQHHVSINTVAFGTMSVKRRLKEIMNVKKLSTGIAVITVIAGIGIGLVFFSKPVKGEELVDVKDKDQVILPKGSDMNLGNAIIVPKEEWEELGLQDLSMYEDVPEGKGGIEKVYKWNIETDDGVKTYYSVMQ